MLTIKQNPYGAPSKLKYKLNRWQLSKGYVFFKRFIFPILLTCLLVFQLVRSETVRTMTVNAKTSIYERVVNLPMFVVKSVSFQNATRLREEEIRSFVDIETDKSIFDMDLDQLRADLSQMDAVGDVSIRYNYTGILEIVLEPRIPAMIYLKDGRLSAIDKFGHRVESLYDRADRADLIVVSGAGAPDAAMEAAELIDMLTPLRAYVRGIVRIGERRWDVVMVDGTKIMLPSEQPGKALLTFLKQERTNHILGREITAIDLRDPKRKSVELSANALLMMEADAN